MNKNVRNILRFFFLLFLQVAVLNRVNFGGYINPQIYILYVILFPYYEKQRSYLLLSSFFLGISIDFFMNSGGINAFSLTLAAYLRRPLYGIIMGQLELSSNSPLREMPFLKSLNYIFLLTFIHHLAFFWLENFSFDELGLMFLRVIISSVYTTLLILLTLSLFLRKK